MKKKKNQKIIDPYLTPTPRCGRTAIKEPYYVDANWMHKLARIYKGDTRLQSIIIKTSGMSVYKN